LSKKGIDFVIWKLFFLQLFLFPFMQNTTKCTFISDQANNMRSRELLHFLLSPNSEIKSFLKDNIYVSYFGACHGKSESDSYFARLSKVLKILCLTESISSIELTVSSLTEKFKQYKNSTHEYVFLKCVNFFYFCYF
jgi:hypothetical protein